MFKLPITCIVGRSYRNAKFLHLYMIAKYLQAGVLIILLPSAPRTLFLAATASNFREFAAKVKFERTAIPGDVLRLPNGDGGFVRSQSLC